MMLGFISLHSYDSLCQRGSVLVTCVSPSANSIVREPLLESSNIARKKFTNITAVTKFRKRHSG